jgi:hypothetical protein
MPVHDENYRERRDPGRPHKLLPVLDERLVQVVKKSWSWVDLKKKAWCRLDDATISEAENCKDPQGALRLYDNALTAVQELVIQANDLEELLKKGKRAAEGQRQSHKGGRRRGAAAARPKRAKS